MAKKEDEKKKTVAKKTKKAASVKKTTKVAKKTGFIPGIFAPWQDSPVKFSFYDIIAKIFCHMSSESKIFIALPVCVVISLVVLSSISSFLVPITDKMTDTAGLTNYKDLREKRDWYMRNVNMSMSEIGNLNNWLQQNGLVSLPKTHFEVEKTAEKVESIVYWLLFLLILIFFRFQSKKAGKYRKLMKIES